ncbi:hypothetical protein J437_LFUL012422 [Ladona fulva]|uniref:MADF domain-containing protein n=1 Tax=Ladona fulva TaxID=123851 RepID=A0A8K0P372_LADFU|nr:hypothetical protein J437_LFUL012422 [Ladona fulva]
MKREKENQCLEEFILLYESEPCLWKMKSPDYHDRLKKDAAYARLVEKWKEVEPSSTKLTILRKINNLRSSYRKELKKVKESMKSGSLVEEVYVPKLWYFKLLQFLDEQEMPQSSRSSLHSDDDISDHDEEETYNSATNAQHERLGFDEKNPSIQTPEIRLPTSQVLATPGISGSCQKPTARPFLPAIDTNTLRNEVLMSVKEHFKKPCKQEDRLDMFGKIIVMKLRDLDPNQRRYAEKFINDVLFEAEGGNLDATYAFVRQVPPQYQSF